MSEQRYREQMRRIAVLFTVGMAAVVAYTVLVLLDVSLLYVWPLLLVTVFASFKLFTIGS